jgi:hypothetical protein
VRRLSTRASSSTRPPAEAFSETVLDNSLRVLSSSPCP